VRSLIVCALLTAVLTGPAWSEEVFPSRLSGRWTSVDGRNTDLLFLIADSPEKGLLTVSSGIAQCTISGAPVSIKKLEDSWAVIVDPSYTNPCRKEVSLILKQTTASTYEGELHQRTLNGQYPTLKVKLSP
jgi:hypothetical protein